MTTSDDEVALLPNFAVPSGAKSYRGISFEKLKVAIDPGHMGGPYWDKKTGKFITDNDSNLVSEGTQVLILSLLLKERLDRFGFSTLITRTTFDPVARMNSNEDLSDFIKVKDIDARVEMINRFNPDITLIIHMDEHTSKGNHNISALASRCNDTKAYIPGAFSKEDLQDEFQRKDINQILNNLDTWAASWRLSKVITQSISRNLDVPLYSEESKNFKLVEPGVLTRNLRLQRKLGNRVSSYIETICYESPTDFSELQKREANILIGGEKVDYSYRLVKLSDAILEGILKFLE